MSRHAPALPQQLEDTRIPCLLVFFHAQALALEAATSQKAIHLVEKKWMKCWECELDMPVVPCMEKYQSAFKKAAFCAARKRDVHANASPVREGISADTVYEKTVEMLIDLASTRFCILKAHATFDREGSLVRVSKDGKIACIFSGMDSERTIIVRHDSLPPLAHLDIISP